MIVNTCAVTAEAGRKSRQAIHRLREENPGAVAAVLGCYSQLSPDAVQKLGADIVYGTADRLKLIDAVEKAVATGEGEKALDKPFERRVFEELPAGAVSGHTRALLKIQDGCVNFCSYCIIPYTRGRVRSLPMEAAVRQAAELDRQGYRELVITGIEIASYGKDFKPQVPRIEAFDIPKEYIGAVIGPGGKIIQGIQEDTGAIITIEETDGVGKVQVSAPNKESIEAAVAKIRAIVAIPEVGETYDAKVVSIMPYGCFVEFMPGKEGLLHISELDWKRFDTVEEAGIHEGDTIKVKLLDIDEKTGKFRLSHRALLEKPEGYEERPARRPDRGPRPQQGQRRERNDNRGPRRERGERFEHRNERGETPAQNNSEE